MDSLNTPGTLWRKLQTDAGLEIRRKSGRPGRDIDLEDGVKTALGVSIGDTPLGGWLDSLAGRDQVSVEQLLVAVLTSQRDYASMMRDMLKLLIAANAKRDGTTLGLQFKFDAVSDPLRIELEAFREVAQQAQRIVSSRYMLPDARSLWGLSDALRTAANRNVNLVRVESIATASDLAESGNASLDNLLMQIADLIREFHAYCNTFGSSRSEVNEKGAVLARSDDDADKRAGEILIAVRDLWDIGMVDALEHLARQVRSGAAFADAALSILGQRLASMDLREYWTASTYAELVEMLQLPTWKKRHELFSVWAGSVLLRTAEARNKDFRFLTTDGVLSFAFGGSRLATYTRDEIQFDIWAELRSTLIGSSAKRSKGIQPDFRILRPSLAGSIGAQTHFVLECKHYLTPRVSNFSQAAQDYARSCPDARVLVVNHGPINANALQKSVEPSLRNQIQFLGSVTPANQDKATCLAQAIEQALFASLVHGESPEDDRTRQTHELPAAAASATTSVFAIEQAIRKHLNLEFGRLRPSDFERIDALKINDEAALRDTSSLARMNGLRSLHLVDCASLSDISAVAKLKNLTRLDLSGCTALADISPLEWLRELESLTLSRCHSVQDLSPIWDLQNLYHLDLSDCPGITSVEDLARLDSLRRLNLSDTARLTDLRPLGQLHGLTDLELSGSPAIDLSPLEGLVELEALKLSRCENLQTIAPLVSLSKLSKIRLSECTSLTDLSGLDWILRAASLLDLTGCAALSDLTQVGNMSSLEQLVLIRCFGLNDLSYLSDLQNLILLDLTRCANVKDISPLASLEKLSSLDLARCTSVSDFSPLAKLRHLHILDLSNCPQLVDLSPIAQMEGLSRLSLVGCTNIGDLSPLTELPSLLHLDVSGCPAASRLPKQFFEREKLRIIGRQDLQ